MAEDHAFRRDPKSKKRVVRNEPPVAWVPKGVTINARDYTELLRAHRKDDAVWPDQPIHRSVTKNEMSALHLLVKFPESVPVATREDAEKALELVVGFAIEIWGDRAILGARMDRDEKSLINADVLMCPIYTKVTKKTSKESISLSYHLKKNAEKYGLTTNGLDSLSNQGRALQDAWADYLVEKGFEAERGKPKKPRGDDWVDPELAGLREEAKKELEAAEAAKVQQDAEHAAAMAKLATEAEALRIKDARLNKELAREAARKVGVEKAKEKAKAELDRAVIVAGEADAKMSRAVAAMNEVKAEREKVENMWDQANTLLKAVKKMVRDWNLLPVVERVLLGEKGRKAVEIVESDEVTNLMAMMGKGRSGGR